MDVDKSLAAMRAASLQMLATSAPVNPGVRADNFRAKSSLSKSVFNAPKCTLNMEARPCKLCYARLIKKQVDVVVLAFFPETVRVLLVGYIYIP